MGGKDEILDAEVVSDFHLPDIMLTILKRVRRYLSSHGVRKNLWYDPEGRHGSALLKGGQCHDEIMRWLSENED